SHTDALSFVVSTALAYIEYYSNFSGTVLGTLTTASYSVLDINVVTATVVTTAQTTNTLQTFELLGTLKTGNAVTTIKPQITFSAGPTGTCQTLRGSYITFYPIASQ